MLAIFALLPLLVLANAAPTTRQEKQQFISVKIKASRDDRCLSLGPQSREGAPVISASCEAALVWTLNRGDGKIFSGDGTLDLVIDFGEDTQNGGTLMIQKQNGSNGQNIYYTDDNRLAHTGGNQCFDEGDNGIQTWQCTDNNDNQVWYTMV